MSNRTKKNCAVLACTLSAAAASMSHAAITQVDYSAVVSNTSENFSGFASGGSGPRDTVVQGNGLSFGERFAGQQLGTQTIDFPGFFTSSYDVLSGSPTSVLTLEAGSADRNLWIGDTQTQTGFVIAGCGINGSAFGPRSSSPIGVPRKSTSRTSRGPLGNPTKFGRRSLGNGICAFPVPRRFAKEPR